MTKELFTNYAETNDKVCIYCPFFAFCSPRIRTRCKGLVKCGCEIAKLFHEFHTQKREPATDSAFNFLRRNYALFMNVEKTVLDELLTPHSAETIQDGINFRRALRVFFSAFSVFIEEPLHDLERMSKHNDTEEM